MCFGGVEDKYGKIINEIIVRYGRFSGAGLVPASYIFKTRRKAECLKIFNLKEVAALGHSQGGAGVFNAITVQSHSAVYKTAVSLSPANVKIAAKPLSYWPPVFSHDNPYK